MEDVGCCEGGEAAACGPGGRCQEAVGAGGHLGQLALHVGAAFGGGAALALKVRLEEVEMGHISVVPGGFSYGYLQDFKACAPAFHTYTCRCQVLMGAQQLWRTDCKCTLNWSVRQRDDPPICLRCSAVFIHVRECPVQPGS
jgi:hypothetical protein